MRHPSAPHRAGFTLIEILVVVAIIGILVALLGVAVTGVRLRAQEEKTISLMKRLETGVQTYITRYNAPPPVPPVMPAGALPPAAPQHLDIGTNYRNSGALHYYLGSNLLILSGFDSAGVAKVRKKQTPMVDFQKSEISTWNSMLTPPWPAGRYAIGQPNGDIVANGGGPQSGLILDTWQSAVAYVVLPTAPPGTGDHTTAAFLRPGANFNRPGRNLTGSVQIWSRGIDRATNLPTAGPAPNNATGQQDDIINWFLPYY